MLITNEKFQVPGSLIKQVLLDADEASRNVSSIEEDDEDLDSEELASKNYENGFDEGIRHALRVMLLPTDSSMFEGVSPSN